VLYSCSKNAGVEVVTHVALIFAIELSPKEGGDILRLNGLDGCTNERFIERAQIGLFLKEYVRMIFSLHDTPAIGDTVLCCNRAVPFN